MTDVEMADAHMPTLPVMAITATAEAPTPAATPVAAHDSPIAASSAPSSCCKARKWPQSR
jgi:hypothetical protein